MIYRRAIEDGDLAVNPCERLRLPTARGRRERIASPSEAVALITALRPEDRALWGCAFYAGLRRGELRALLWNDVDLADGLIRVERSMSGHGETGRPKSRAGRRGVPIVAALRELLVEHKARDAARLWSCLRLERDAAVHADRRAQTRSDGVATRSP